MGLDMKPSPLQWGTLSHSKSSTNIKKPVCIWGEMFKLSLASHWHWCDTAGTTILAGDLHAIRVVFENVSFAYQGAEENVLTDISFDASPGHTVALLGATGSGKSSIVNLIPRFYDATAGRILIDGRDVREYDLDIFMIVFI